MPRRPARSLLLSVPTRTSLPPTDVLPLESLASARPLVLSIATVLNHPDTSSGDSPCQTTAL